MDIMGFLKEGELKRLFKSRPTTFTASLLVHIAWTWKFPGYVGCASFRLLNIEW
jgi:hypothetical protein